MVAFDQCTGDEATFLELLERGQLPPLNLLKMVRDVELILDGIKYKLCCTRTGSSEFQIAVAGESSKFATTSVRMLSDGGYLISNGGKSHVAYQTSKADAASGMKLSVNGRTIAFSPDYDPSSLRTDVAGKLVKKLVPNGASVKKGSAYAEIEVMKMFMPLKVEESGVITWANNEGAALSPGDLLATLELENPENVSTATVFKGDLDVMGWGSAPTSASSSGRPHITLRKALDRLKNGMAGYVLSSDAIDVIMKEIADAVTDPSLPAYEIDDQLSVLNGRIDGTLFDELSKMTSDKGSSKFPADQFKHSIAMHMGTIKDEAERASFVALTAPLVDAADPYTKSLADKVPGAERVLNRFLDILREWISVERWFCDGISYADVVDNMRKTNKDNNSEILDLCRAHALLKSTSAVIMKIIDSIAEAGRTDASSMTMTSVVLGAEGLVDATPCLTDIASMRGNETFDVLSQRCRNVLIEESLPSIEERKSKVLAVAKTLAIKMDDDASRQVQELINDNIVGSDILLPLLRAATDVKQQLAILEISARKQHRTFDIKEVNPIPDHSTLKFTYCDKPKTSVFSSSAGMTSMTDLTRAMSSSKLSDLSRSDSESSLKSQEDEVKVTKTAVTKICNAMSDIQGDKDAFKSLLEHFPQYNGSVPRCESGPSNVLSVLVLQDYSDTDQDRLAQSIEQLLARHLEDLEKADIRRVSFIVSKDGKADNNQHALPSVFTFRETDAFKEDHLYRDIEPTVSYQLEMLRLAKNFSLSCLGDHLSPSGQIYLYKATPKASALAQDKKANKGPRIFARAVSFINDFSAGSFEQLLIEAFNALEAIKTSVPPGDNHLFINIVSAHKSTVIDPVAVEQVVASILKRHSERTKRLGIAEVEAKAVCKLANDDDSHPISLRLVASNPTGFVQVMNTYVEASDESGSKRSKRVFKSIGGTKANMAGSGDSSWEGLDITTPYPLTRPFDAQRKAALRSSDTLYCYDLPALFEASVEKQWASVSASGTQPTMVMFTTELIVRNKSGGSWTMQDYMNGDLELVETQRKAGKNDVGMVAWLMTLKTVECPTVSCLHVFHLTSLCFTRSHTLFIIALFSIPGSTSYIDC